MYNVNLHCKYNVKIEFPFIKISCATCGQSTPVLIFLQIFLQTLVYDSLLLLSHEISIKCQTNKPPSYTAHAMAQHSITGNAYIVRLTPNLRKKNTVTIPSLHR